MPKPLEVSEFGRYVVYVVQWSWYGAKDCGLEIFSTYAEALLAARFNARTFINWKNFPDPRRQYPNDDRDGTEVPVLNPIFVAQWDKEGGGKVEVSSMEVSDRFEFAGRED